MRVVYILPISWGGIPHYTAELANAVSEYADVTVIKPKDSNNDLFSENVEVIDAFEPLYFSRENMIKAFSFKNIKNFISFKNIRIVDKIKPDAIHFTGLYPHISFFTYLSKLDKKYPTIYTVHAVFGSFVISPRGRDLILALLHSINMIAKTLIKPDRIIVHTQANKDVLVKDGSDQKKVIVIPHGAYSFFNIYSKNTEIESEENCILFFGYMGKNKGIEYLIKAIPFVSQEIPDIKVIIAGEGEFAKYSKYIIDESKFEIYNEFIPNEKVPELFERAKIVVLPYTYHQGHSGILAVAYAFKKAAIVTDVGDLPNLVDGGKIGLVVPPNDPEALAKAIIKLLEDVSLRKQMEENAYKKAQELSWDNIAKKYIEVYKEVIEARNSERMEE